MGIKFPLKPARLLPQISFFFRPSFFFFLGIISRANALKKHRERAEVYGLKEKREESSEYLCSDTKQREKVGRENGRNFLTSWYFHTFIYYIHTYTCTSVVCTHTYVHVRICIYIYITNIQFSPR